MNLLKIAVLEGLGYIWKNIVLNAKLLKADLVTFCLGYIKWLILWPSKRV